MNEVLKEASIMLNGSRYDAYGDPVENFERIAELASILTGYKLTPKDIAMIMIAVKLSRETYKHKMDNLIDIAGYAQIYQDLSVATGEEKND